MSAIKKIEFKLEYNEKILKETIENICFGKDISPNIIDIRKGIKKVRTSCILVTRIKTSTSTTLSK